MPRGRPIEPVVLTDDEKDRLLSLANSRSLPHCCSAQWLDADRHCNLLILHNSEGSMLHA